VNLPAERLADKPAFPIKFPAWARRRRITAALLSILAVILLSLSILWILVYQSAMASISSQQEDVSFEAQLMLTWYGASSRLLQRPAGIAYDSTRSLFFVTDSRLGRVFVLDKDAKEVTSFAGDSGSTDPTDDFKLERPTSVAVASTGQVYVVDAALQKLVIFDEGYKPIRAIRFEEEPPKSVAVVRTAQGEEQLWVVSYSGLTRGTLEGDFEWGYYARGKDIGQFNNPTALTSLSNEASTTIVVADSFNYRIQAFDVDGDTLTPLWVFGETQDEKEGDVSVRGNRRPLDLPIDIATDGKSQVFVLDGMGTTIVTLDAFTGEPITTFGKVGSGEGQLLYPSAISYGGGRIWIADQGNARVSAFSQEEIVPVPPLARRQLPVDIFLALVGVLAAFLAGCLIWLAMIRPTRTIFSLDALENIEAREEGLTISEAFERIYVQEALESYAREVCMSADVKGVAHKERAAAKLGKKMSTRLHAGSNIDGDLSAHDGALLLEALPSVDREALIAAKSIRRSVFVVENPELFNHAKDVGIKVVEVNEVIKEVKAAIAPPEVAPHKNVSSSRT
jgi:DNA-binding beta-propeller fold protein YncE